MLPLALVTGSAHRLGKVFALSLARMGYSIALHYHSAEDEAMQTKAEIEALGVQAFPIQADLSVPHQIDKLFAGLEFSFNPLSFTLRALVNSAAIMPVGYSLKNWDDTLNLNLRAPYLLAQESAKRMTEGGLIVNVTDIGAQKAWSRYPAYIASKAALEALTKSLARKYAPGIRVNSIALGLVLPSDVVSTEEWERLVNRLPLKRAARLDEVASALEFLVKNEYVTGQAITVDGGYSLV